MRSFLLAACLTAFIAPSAKSHTHFSPDGTIVSWYPKECCHDRDCRPVVQIRSVGAGLWMTTDDGQTVLVTHRDERRRSLDLRWHVCLASDRNGGLIVQCLFEPPSS